MKYTFTRESFDSLASYWADPDLQLKWDTIFVLPAWLKVWTQYLNSTGEPYLGAAREEEGIIGIAPLLIKDNRTAAIIGSTDVCDFLDFVVVPARENDFFTALLDDLSQKGIRQLDLGLLRPDSTVLTKLVDIAKQRGCEALCQPEDVSQEMDLPATWDEYLEKLDKKQRHEVRRKLRRLWGADKIDFRYIEAKPPVGDLMDTFLKLFTLSRHEKANFMDARREAFFRSLAEAMAEIGVLRFGILEVDTLAVAMFMAFDYNNTIYLYNSAYDPRYNSLSVGLLCKVLGIKESIERGKQKWDFLKGEETYKSQLGGREVPLSRCQITIK